MWCFKCSPLHQTPAPSPAKNITPPYSNTSHQLQYHQILPTLSLTPQTEDFPTLPREVVGVLAPVLGRKYFSAHGRSTTSIDPNSITEAKIPVHTFTADWSDEGEGLGDSKEAVFIVDCRCGTTWPLRKKRLNKNGAAGADEASYIFKEEAVDDEDFGAPLERMPGIVAKARRSTPLLDILSRSETNEFLPSHGSPSSLTDSHIHEALTGPFLPHSAVHAHTNPPYKRRPCVTAEHFTPPTSEDSANTSDPVRALNLTGNLGLRLTKADFVAWKRRIDEVERLEGVAIDRDRQAIKWNREPVERGVYVDVGTQTNRCVLKVKRRG